MQQNWITAHWEQIEHFGLYLMFAALFFLIGMAIQDVLKKGDVPKFGRYMVWLVLFLGCAGFIAKGVIKVIFQSTGTGG